MAGAKKALKGFNKILAFIARKDTVFGSDIYVAYTHRYVWQANQFGHILIGLFVGLLVSWLSHGSIWAFVSVVGLYFVKELLDFLIAYRLQEGVFPVKVSEALRDGFTDWFFVASGTALALVIVSIGASGPWKACTAVGQVCLTMGWREFAWSAAFWITGVAFLLPVVYFAFVRTIYLPRKDAFDKSGLPHYMRLPTFPNNFKMTDKELKTFASRILSFARKLDTTGQLRHLVVSGPPGSGRTTFAVSLGGEATNRSTKRRKAKVRYLTGTRLREKAQDAFEVASDTKQPHAVGEADLVIVDQLGKYIFGSATKDAVSKTLNSLVDTGWKPGATVFQRPVADRPRKTPGQKARKPTGRPVRPMPKIVWVVDDEKAAARLFDVLKNRFKLNNRQILLVALRERLEDTRVMSAAV